MLLVQEAIVDRISDNEFWYDGRALGVLSVPSIAKVPLTVTLKSGRTICLTRAAGDGNLKQRMQIILGCIRIRNGDISFGHGFCRHGDSLPNDRLPNHLECVNGVHATVQDTKQGTVVIVDRTHMVLMKIQPFVNMIGSVMDKARTRASLENIVGSRDEKIVNKAIDKFKVKAGHTNISYRVLKLAPRPSEHTFEDKEGVKWSVQTWTEKKLGFPLKHPKWPCIQMYPAAKNRFLPLEVLHVARGQRYDMSKVLQIVGRDCAMDPHDRYPAIQKEVATLTKSSGEGIIIKPGALVVNGEVLAAPAVLYNGQSARPRDGAWRLDRSTKYFAPGTGGDLGPAGVVKRWGILGVDIRQKLAESMLKSFSDECTARGLRVLASNKGGVSCCRTHDVASTMAGLKKAGVDFLIVVLGGRDDRLYNRVKEAENKLGMRTQCLKEKTAMSLERRPGQIPQNLSMKINAKLGGVTAEVKSWNSDRIPTMLMGLDVTHFGGSGRESVAAVCCSVNLYGSKYEAYALQTGERVEVLPAKSVFTITQRAVQRFHKCTRMAAKRVIVFRDGVGDGQFMEVQAAEVASMNQAVGKDVELVVLCAQKRHHVRLFAPRNDNVGAGTFVNDSKLCRTNDFYLNSHSASTIGTNRCTHYAVLHDDNRAARTVQRLKYLGKITNALCYNHSRCTRAVSIPTPLYYAHLCAFRARAAMPKVSPNGVALIPNQCYV